jgi:hypothetical protein
MSRGGKGRKAGRIINYLVSFALTSLLLVARLINSFLEEINNRRGLLATRD